jgi:hypothetical protein
MRRLAERIGGWMLVVAGPAGAYGAGLRYLERGDLQAAAEAFADAQRLWERQIGPWHRDVPMAMARRAACYVMQGRVSAGVRLYERALALERQVGGEDSERARVLAWELSAARAGLLHAGHA